VSIERSRRTRITGGANALLRWQGAGGGVGRITGAGREAVALTLAGGRAIVGHMSRLPGGRGFLPFLKHASIPLFSVLGIRVVAHYSWFAIAALIVWVLTVGWFPRVLPACSSTNSCTAWLRSRAASP